jgi:hypothetical protein
VRTVAPLPVSGALHEIAWAGEAVMIATIGLTTNVDGARSSVDVG